MIMPDKSSKQFSTDDMIIRCAVDEDVVVLRELFERSRIEGQTHENDTGADLDHLMACKISLPDTPETAKS